MLIGATEYLDSLALTLRTQAASQVEASQVEATQTGSSQADVRRFGLSQAEPSEAERQFLVFDNRGDGRAVEVFGNLGAADRVGIWVPGVATDLGDFKNPGGLAAKRIWATTQGVTMIEWLNYDPPDSILAAGVDRGMAARAANADLNAFIARLKANGVEHVVLGGHSYGSVVVAYASAAGTQADELVLVGSPGVPVDSVTDFHLARGKGSPQNVHVLTNQADPVSGAHLVDEVLANIVSVSPFGSGLSFLSEHLGRTVWPAMGFDPSSPGFGAEILEGQHDGLSGLFGGTNHDYTEPNSRSLEVLSAVFEGRNAAQ